MHRAETSISLAGSQLGELRHVCAFFSSDDEESQFRGEAIIVVLRTYPLAIVGGVLQQNPFFVPPEEFLREVRAGRAERVSRSAATT